MLQAERESIHMEAQGVIVQYPTIVRVRCPSGSCTPLSPCYGLAIAVGNLPAVQFPLLRIFCELGKLRTQDKLPQFVHAHRGQRTQWPSDLPSETERCAN